MVSCVSGCGSGSGKAITEAEVRVAQDKWAKGLVDIGRAKLQGGDYATIADKVIDDLYAYGKRPVQFKPTKAAETQFRDTRNKARSYFIGGDAAFPEDAGFALTPWTAVRFDQAGFTLMGDSAMSMGNYYFTDTSGKDTKVEYTFGYARDDVGCVRIVLHHSSLPYAPPEAIEAPVPLAQPVPELAPAVEPAPVRTPSVKVGESFNVVVPKGNKSMGINVNSFDNVTLLITRVNPGVILDFNLANPGRELIPGDRVEVVNGVQGDSTAMLAECKTATELRFGVQRSEEKTVHLNGSADLGMEFKCEDSMTLSIQQIMSSGAVTDHNLKFPGFKVTVEDRIVGVNNIRNDPVGMTASLLSGEHCEVALRRISAPTLSP